MKVHTNRFKEEIGSFGRQIDSIITYQLNGVTQTITSENLNGVTPTFQGSILKSVMKQLDVDSNINIPIGTSINYKFGVLVDGKFEYLDFGNYVVYSSEKQEDYDSYKIVCYDKMLYSMKQNEDLGVTYPISVRDYLKALCNKLGLQFKNANDNFANYSRMIQKELYVGLDYTYRDILDELAQVTASTICLNENDELELRYISNTAVDTIDEEYLKDININFGQKNGPVNSIVLSRSAESDNVYLQDEESIQANGLCELKIVDNQIMNWNDRSDYLPEILAELDGLEYYINDFVSTGIAYLELCDRYNVKIGDNTYSCVMLNDEFEVTQGLVENIHTDMPEETETDYTKADKTDRKINNVSIIVDKQQNQIELLANKIVDISAQASGHKEVKLENCSATPLYKLKITGDDSLLFPNSNIFPSSTTYLKDSLLYLNMGESNEKKYDLKIPALRELNGVKDEYNLENTKATLTKRIGLNANLEEYILNKPQIIDLGEITIELNEGTNILTMPSFPNNYYEVTYLLKNDYTDVFASQAELHSEINVTSDKIELLSKKKVNNDEIIASINLTPEKAQIDANKISLKGKEIDMTSDNININSTNFKVDRFGNCTANSFNSNDATITGGLIDIINEVEGKPSIQIRRTDGTGEKYSSFINESNFVSRSSYQECFIGAFTASDKIHQYGFYVYDRNNTGTYAEIWLRNGNPTISLVSNNTGHAVTANEGLVSISDKKLKENIDYINKEKSIDIIRELKPIEFNYINKERKHRGLIAQEVKETLNKNNIYDEIYNYDNTFDSYTLSYEEFIPDLINCVKYQQEQIEELEKRIEKLERNDK